MPEACRVAGGLDAKTTHFVAFTSNPLLVGRWTEDPPIIAAVDAGPGQLVT
jgi:hypothetical protein